MFYPEEALRKGGRFYWCWLADSWPLSFASITHRQLWAQDILKICNGLLEAVNSESGRPSARFSLRLSSQLLRGVARLYQKKVDIMLADMCMINARVMKNSHKKYNFQSPAEESERRPLPLLEQPAPREPAPEPEERVEEILQQSGNIVANVEDITLKEAVIPEILLPVNDNFGEENPLQALRLEDRTLEQMLGASTSAAHSGLGAPADRSPADRSALQLEAHAQMERISDLDATVFRKSTEQDLLPAEFERDIPIPEIPPQEPPVPIEKETAELDQIVPTAEMILDAPVQREKPAQVIPQEEEIEELEELEPQEKRRRRNKLIIDKRTKLPSSYFRSRLDNVALELRCENSSEDIADLRVPWEVLSARPAHAGARGHSRLGRRLHRLFSARAGLAASHPVEQRELEQALASRSRRSQPLEVITEEPPVLEPQVLEPKDLESRALEPEAMETVMLDQVELPMEEARADRTDLRPSVLGDISDLPTQKINVAQKRKTSRDKQHSPIKRRTSGVTSFRQHQLLSQERHQPEASNDSNDKENVPQNRILQLPEIVEPAPEIPTEKPPAASEENVTSLLQEAGLADVETRPTTIPGEEEPQKVSRPRGSGSSETMLGSLDRTLVSLGESEHTTDSQRFLRDHWGTEGTMLKILRLMKQRTRPVTMDALMAGGPLLPGDAKRTASRAFMSILKLKQHGFLTIVKHPEISDFAMADLQLGPKFTL